MVEAEAVEEGEAAVEAVGEQPQYLNKQQPPMETGNWKGKNPRSFLEIEQGLMNSCTSLNSTNF